VTETSGNGGQTVSRVSETRVEKSTLIDEPFRKVTQEVTKSSTVVTTASVTTEQFVVVASGTEPPLLPASSEVCCKIYSFLPMLSAPP
jgi:hypothetical protein